MLTTTDQLPHPMGPAKALPAPLKDRLERFFSVPLGWVRIYPNCDLRALTARACACGNAIYFAPHAYEPATPWGAARIAHEVAHLLQEKTLRQKDRLTDLKKAGFDRLEKRAQLAARAFTRETECPALVPVRVFSQAGVALGSGKKPSVRPVLVQCDGARVVANMKAKTAAVWNAFTPEQLSTWQGYLRQGDGDPNRLAAIRHIYQIFYNTFNAPDDRPANPRHSLSFDQINDVVCGLGARQFAFLGTHGNRVNIQDNIFRPVNGQGNYPNVFWSLPLKELYYCFYHFIPASIDTGGRSAIRLAVNVAMGRIPDALDNWLLGCRTVNPDVTAFKVGAPGLYGKPDTVLLYILKPGDETQQGYLSTLINQITTWAGSNVANTLRDWTHPLMDKLANGIALADDPPGIPDYNGLSFTALRAVIATIVVSTIIRLNYAGTTGDLAAAALMGQLENYGIDPQDPSKNNGLADSAAIAKIVAIAQSVGAIVS